MVDAGHRVKPTPAEVEAREQNRHEYEQRLERKEYKRRHTQAKRQEAKEMGLCKGCRNPAISGQTRCETCAEKHRESRRRWQAQRKRKPQAPGQTKFF